MSTDSIARAGVGLDLDLGRINGNQAGDGGKPERAVGGAAGGGLGTDAARLDARTLWSMGLKKAAVARLCLNDDIYRAMPEVCRQYLPPPAPRYPAPRPVATRYAQAESLR